MNAALQQFVRAVLVGAVISIVSMGQALADGIRVTVLDREGRPVPDVVVYVESDPSQAPAGTTAVVDQVDQRFVPHLLVVQAGTSVEFPNSDVVAHHVYSFSHPNHFKLPIYKGHAHPPVAFDESGLVVLGCNIHDDMLAYILVVDTPLFAKTNEDGLAVIDSKPEDGAAVSIWSPRIRDKANTLTVTIEGDNDEAVVAFNLEKALRAPHHEESDALSWNDY